MRLWAKNHFPAYLSLGLFLAAFLNYSPAFSLSADTRQHFDTGTPLANWSVTYAGPQIYFDSSTASNAFGDPTTFNGETTPLTSGIIGAAGTCGSCSVTFTYKDPAPTGVGPYIEVDVYTENIGRQFQISVVDTLGNAVTHTTQDLLYNCAGGGTLASSTIPNTWTTLWVDTSSFANPVSLVNIIIPSGQADQMDTNSVFVDNLQAPVTLPCLVPPTPTNTATNTQTSTFTKTATITPTSTPTNSPTLTPTRTPTPTPTDTATITPTNTPTLSPTNTQPNTPTNSPTLTPPNTSTPTSPATPTNTPPNTPTNSPTVTPSSTPTNTFTVTPTLTLTLSPTNTMTLTNTNTVTLTFTPTITPTPTLSWTPTVTLTPVNTNTPTVTFTITQTPCPMVVYPDPMDFQHSPPYNNNCSAWPNGCIKFGCVPVGSTVNVYTLHLMLVRTFPPGDPNFTPTIGTSVGTITWDGTNGDGNPVSSGFYLYTLDGPSGKSFGKFAISRSKNGP